MFAQSGVSRSVHRFGILKRKALIIIKDTHREKASSNKTPSRSKSMNMDIWVVGTSNQVFIRGS